MAGELAHLLLKIPCDVQLIQTLPSAPEQWLKPNLQFNPDAVIVIGGDGTLRQAARVLSGTSIPLYHAACGTENLFAKSMGMLVPTEKIIDLIRAGNTKLIDTADANGDFMILMASVGFDASVVDDLAAHRGTSIAHLSYCMPIIRQLFRWKVPELTINVDGENVVHRQKGWAVVANSKSYARGLNPARDASNDDGQLDVVFLPFTSRWGLWKWVRLMKRGTHLHHPEAKYARGKMVEVVTNKPTPWQIDGDSVGNASEMHITCVPNSLRVISVT
jgi:diacylglycerol kinase family enzyme